MRKKYLKPEMNSLRIGLYDDVMDDELIFGGRGSHGGTKKTGDQGGDIEPDVKEFRGSLWDEEW